MMCTIFAVYLSCQTRHRVRFALKNGDEMDVTDIVQSLMCNIVSSLIKLDNHGLEKLTRD